MKIGRLISRVAFSRRFPFLTSAQIYHERGVKHAARRDFSQATRDFNEVIKLKPRWAEPYRRLGEVFLGLQAPGTAASWFETAVSLAPQDHLAWAGFLAALLLAGERNKVSEILGLSVELFPEFAFPLPPQIERSSTPLEKCWQLAATGGMRSVPGTKITAILLEMLQRVENFGGLFSSDGEVGQAREIWTSCADWRTRLFDQVRTNESGVRGLSRRWGSAIGHIALIDYYVKLARLGLLADDQPPLVVPLKSVANQALLDYWKPFLKITTESSEVERYYRENPFSELPLEVMRLKDGRSLYYAHAAALAESMWKQQHRGPLLQIQPGHHEKGWKMLFDRGLPEDGWFVCVHVRDGGFRNPHKLSRVAGRNADIRSYFSAFETIRNHGGWVVRIGDSSMVPLPPMDRVIDCTQDAHKRDWLDLFLLSQCRFFIGTNSGPACVPPVFGVPCVYTNWMPLGVNHWFRNNILLHKLYRWEASARLLTYREMISEPVGYLESPEKLSGMGISLIDNTPDDINDAVSEMLLRLESAGEPDVEANQRQSRCDEIALECGSYSGSRVAQRFLKQHADLLDKPASA